MSPSVAREIWSLLEDMKLGVAERTSGLTPREREVLNLIQRGKQRGEVALALNISENTVKHHFSSIYQKLGVRSKDEALIKLRGGRGLLD